MKTGTDGSNTREVYALATDCTVDDIESDTPYLGTVNGVVAYGIFVDVSDHVSGLVHESNLDRSYDVGDEVVVRLETVRESGDLAFDLVPLEEYDIVTVGPTYDRTPIVDLQASASPETVEGRVDQINQTGGPTIFSVTDGTGVLDCAAFEAPGVRAYPDVTTGDFVRVRGTVESRDDGIQLETEILETLSPDDAANAADRIESHIDERSRPTHIDFLIEWDALELPREPLEAIAADLRRMILESRPIRIRHHADGDGMCAAIPLTIALEGFARRVHANPASARHLVSRSPSRAPYYEMEDATRDLNRALADRERHGQRLPMLLMLDNGSTKDDVSAYRNLAHYDIPIAVIDHHHPDATAVENLLSHHVNPYLVGEDYRVTTGMLCVELARMVDPEADLTVRHVPAVAGLADRSDADAMSEYLALAAEAGYATEEVRRIGEALDYASYWLNYRPGGPIVRDILGIDVQNEGRHRGLVAMLSDRAREAMETQLAAALPHVTSASLPNGASFHRLDVDAFAHRFRYPAPGKTTGAIHDHMASDTGEPTITMGCGPDFCVLRSDGVRLDIPRMVEELRDELPGAGVHGGGHLVVGSLKFVPGQREEVLDALVEKMGAAALDAELSTTVTLPDIEE